jgi:hypothetical protein
MEQQQQPPHTNEEYPRDFQQDSKKESELHPQGMHVSSSSSSSAE